jgi:hypothetical protein
MTENGETYQLLGRVTSEPEQVETGQDDTLLAQLQVLPWGNLRPRIVLALDDTARLVLRRVRKGHPVLAEVSPQSLPVQGRTVETLLLYAVKHLDPGDTPPMHLALLNAVQEAQHATAARG